ncbi:hypothetical protein [Carboxylicivirga taeanensis]|uniref:hypothetical protein n=1 Tax=Carboxylicivirga taeanensis TaxID=1416875 RepID=UPI003F6DB05F
MNELNLFLKTLSNVELAKFIVYRYKDFVGTSRETIISEAKSRNLNHVDLRRLYNEDIQLDKSIKSRCEQCGAAKFYTETDYELRHKRYYSIEVALESDRCRICGYNPDKNGKGFMNWIKKKLGFYHNTRITRPEIDGNMFT